MLEVVKNMTLNGVSKIDGQPVAYMNASLSIDGNGSNNINTNIVNRELYNANKEQVRQDIADFDEMVYAQEDELVGGQINEIK